MPFGPLIPAGIELGASVLSAGINKIFGNAQHAQAIDDWNMQNAYNSPKAQMARLKEAGLNPNLVYGQLQNGNAPQVPQQPAGRVSLEGIYSQAVALANQNKQITQTVENLKTNQDLIQANIALARSNTELRDAQVADTQSRINQRDSLMPYQMQMLKTGVDEKLANIQLRGAQTKYSLDENERRELSNSMNLRVGEQKIINMRQQKELDLQRTIGQFVNNSINKKVLENWQTNFEAALRQSNARTEMLKQGTNTSYSQEQLNRATDALKEAQRFAQDNQNSAFNPALDAFFKILGITYKK